MVNERPGRHLLHLAAVVLLAVGGCDSAPTPAGIGGSVRGTVVDDTGAAVSDAAVALTRNGQAARTVTSDADGVYAFADVPPGTYTLTATPPAGHAASAVGTASVTVASGAQAQAPPIVLSHAHAAGSIRGAITDNIGAAVADAEVALTGNGLAARTTRSGPDGVYTFAGVPPGTYTLGITPPPDFTLGQTGTATLTVTSGEQAQAPALVLYSCVVPSGPLRLSFFGGVATQADRDLFVYDASAPLNLQRDVQTSNSVFELSHITYSSPGGGSVTGILVEPVGRTGLRPGIVIMHPSGNPSSPVGVAMEVSNAQLLAAHGAVVIAIDAPFVRRGGQFAPLLTEQDRQEQIQLVKDLQRAVDVLLARGTVDPARIAFTGYSYGAMIGAQFVGIERRLKAAVLTTPPPGHLMLATLPANAGSIASLSCERRNAWFRAMLPIEPIRFISYASPTALLFQIARFDNAVPLADAEAVYNAASGPKEAIYYDTGHGLNYQSILDRHSWLSQHVGIDPRQH